VFIRVEKENEAEIFKYLWHGMIGLFNRCFQIACKITQLFGNEQIFEGKS
jgi:hypothetical protein